jgi:two-component system CAI-1 autoinducer sensor kinase/phosphatase CqsS
LARIQFEVRHMNHMIDLFLLSGDGGAAKPAAGRDGDRWTAWWTRHAQALPFRQRGPAKNRRARGAPQDFTFSGQTELSVVILLNLLRNALKAVQRAGKGRVRIVVDGAACAAAPAVHRHRLRHPGPAAAADLQALLLLSAAQRRRHRPGAVRGHHERLERHHPLRIARSAYTIFVLEFPQQPPPSRGETCICPLPIFPSHA